MRSYLKNVSNSCVLSKSSTISHHQMGYSCTVYLVPFSKMLVCMWYTVNMSAVYQWVSFPVVDVSFFNHLAQNIPVPQCSLKELWDCVWNHTPTHCWLHTPSVCTGQVNEQLRTLVAADLWFTWFVFDLKNKELRSLRFCLGVCPLILE